MRIPHRVLTVSGFHHLALKARRPGPLASFYRDVFGLEERARHVDEEGLRSVWLALEDGLLMVERADRDDPPPPFEAAPSGWHLLAFRINLQDRARWASRLAELGHPMVSETSYSMYFTDPEGHRFALSHYPAASPL